MRAHASTTRLASYPGTRGSLAAASLAALALAGCAQFGVPEVPAHLGEPPWHADGVYVAYLAETVVGFGHTAVLVRDESGGWIRYEQLASAEVRYGQRLSESTARSWEVITARIPSILGLTREVVTRLEGESPATLRYGGEQLFPIPGLDPTPVLEAAERRWMTAPRLEANTAPRYQWALNNSHHFTRDVLSAGGPIHDRYFPKHFVQAYLDGPPGEVASELAYGVSAGAIAPRARNGIAFKPPSEPALKAARRAPGAD